MPHSPTRLLLVEDDARRHAWFSRALTSLTGAKLVWAKTGKAAVTLLKKDAPETYSGVLLDHDLHTDSSVLEGNGREVADTVALRVDVATPVLVHSMNTQHAPAMERSLARAGFDVTRIRFVALVAEPGLFTAWLEKVKERSAELAEDREVAS